MSSPHIAANCTEKEDAARKVEREMSKRLAAVAMQNPGSAPSSTRLSPAQPPRERSSASLQPHVEGLLAQGQQGVDVGDKFRVKLIRVDVQRGFIDFARV